MIIPKEEIEKFNKLQELIADYKKNLPQNTLETLQRKTEFLVQVMLKNICTSTQKYIPLFDTIKDKPGFRYDQSVTLGLSYKGLVQVQRSYRDAETVRAYLINDHFLHELYNPSTKQYLLSLMETNERAKKLPDVTQFVKDLYDLPQLPKLGYGCKFPALDKKIPIEGELPATFDDNVLKLKSFTVNGEYAYYSMIQLQGEDSSTIDLADLTDSKYLRISEPEIYNKIVEILTAQIQSMQSYIQKYTSAYTELFSKYEHYVAMQKLAAKTEGERQVVEAWFIK